MGARLDVRLPASHFSSDHLLRATRHGKSSQPRWYGIVPSTHLSLSSGSHLKKLTFSARCLFVRCFTEVSTALRVPDGISSLRMTMIGWRGYRRFRAGRFKWTKIVRNGLPVELMSCGSRLDNLRAKSMSIGPRLAPNGTLALLHPSLNAHHGTTKSNLNVSA